MRQLLRNGGFRPTGRYKPAWEYLVKAAAAGRLRSIHAAVDACNAASLHSGIAMRVVDLDALQKPLHVGVVQTGEYVFNPSGQPLKLDGLICLCDAQGPCANAVKDSQRTKTSSSSRRTLSIVWGPAALAPQVEACFSNYLQLLERLGTRTSVCNIVEII
jgi:DNA/RNA-binding domain of Phe-tRNA-synthetase-like protein